MDASETTLHNDVKAIAAEFRDYAYSVSHDLSAPVRAMVEFSKLLTTEHSASLNDEGREYLSIIISSGQKMQQMMEGLLQFSRLNTMAKPFALVPVDKILQDCQIILKEQLSTKKAVLEIEKMPMIYADAEQLMQLFLLLLDNAIKFQSADNKPHIKITAVESEAVWQFSIEDNGIGIDIRFQEKIFKLFQRLHAEEEYPGVGAGLTLAQKIIHRHGGTIWFESVTKKGTKFNFTIPKQ